MQHKKSIAKYKEYEVVDIDRYCEDELFATIRDTLFGEEFTVQAYKEDDKWEAKYEEDGKEWKEWKSDEEEGVVTNDPLLEAVLKQAFETPKESYYRSLDESLKDAPVEWQIFLFVQCIVHTAYRLGKKSNNAMSEREQ
ncbi:MAG: hypothetical protein ACXQTR_02645 [Candidatus Methanospirareceae archaeon]